MKIAFLHLAYCGNMQEENQAKILCGMELAARYNAEWVITPEMALQGYQMMREDYAFQVASLENGVLKPFQKTAARFKQRLFLGCAYSENREPYNSLVVINPDGSYYGQHAKVKVVPWITEQWAHTGEIFEVWDFESVKTSVMVCADMYFAEHGEMVAEAGAQLIVGGACWPPGGHAGPPEEAWKRLSKAAGNITVLVSNQTGNKHMDCSKAQSAVVDKGEVLFTYEGQEAVLIVDYDNDCHKIVSKEFKMVMLDEF